MKIRAEQDLARQSLPALVQQRDISIKILGVASQH